MIKKRQTYVESFTEKTVYFEELIEFELTLKIANTQQSFLIIIFIDSQVAIRIIKFSKQQFDQFIL